MMVLDQKSKITKVITIHPEGDINVCTLISRQAIQQLLREIPQM